MPTFKDANQARVSLKMYLSNYSWYSNSVVFISNEGYQIGIVVRKNDHTIKNIVPQSMRGIAVKLLSE